MNLVTRILENLSVAPSRVFCHFHHYDTYEAISYEALLSRSLDYALHFKSIGLGRGDIILLILRHSPDLYYAFLGAILCGCIPSQLPFPTPRQNHEAYWAEMQALFARVQASLLLTYPENITTIEKYLNRQLLTVCSASGIEFQSRETGRLQNELRSMCAGYAVSDREIAFLQHSSGTTGLRKGVALSHRAVLRQIDSYAARLEIRESDIIASWLPLYHDLGLIACCILPMIMRVKVVSIDAFEWVLNPLILFRLIEKYRCTHCWLPNFAFHHLCRADDRGERFDISSVKAFINGSEPCKPETFDLFYSRFQAWGVRPESLQTCYGMAESVLAVSQAPAGQSAKRITASRSSFQNKGIIITPDETRETDTQQFISCGIPIDGMRVRIVDALRKEAPDGHIGEIAISGEMLFSGYFKNECETSRRLIDGWFYTRDLGFIKSGELFVIGRKDDVIIIHGLNIYAHDLEFRLNEIDGVKPGRSVVFGVELPELGTEGIVAMIEIDERASVETKNRVPALVRRKIAEIFDITLLDVVCLRAGGLQKTTSGKISRDANRTRYLKMITAEKYNAAAPAASLLNLYRDDS